MLVTLHTVIFGHMTVVPTSVVLWVKIEVVVRLAHRAQQMKNVRI